MTRDEMIAMAREAGLGEHTNYEYEQIWELKNVEALERFAALVIGLIVRECIAQVRKDENGPAYEAAGRIAQHFGIE